MVAFARKHSPERLRCEDEELEASLGYTEERLSQNKDTPIVLLNNPEKKIGAFLIQCPEAQRYLGKYQDRTWRSPT